jgi:hypothetical protein
MANVLKHDEQEQIRALGRLGWSLRRIEEATGVRRETIARYLRWSGIRLRRPRGRKLGPNAASVVATDPGGLLVAGSKPASEVATDLERPRSSPSASLCEPHREWITAALEQDRNAVAIWQDLVDRHGFTGCYNSVKRYVRLLRGSAVHLAHLTIVTAPGEEAQVDYGDGPMVRHPETGKYRRTRLFALTLAWSRKAVWLLTWKSSTRTWCELHAEAFGHCTVWPPSMTIACPMTKAAASEHSQSTACAISSDRAIRPTGSCETTFARLSAVPPVKRVIIGVST